MTVALETTRFYYDGNGATTSFGFPVPFLDRDSVEVRILDVTTQLEVAATLNGGGATGYTVSGAEDPETGQFLNGAQIVFNSPPPSNYRLYLARKEKITQEVALVDGFKFPASTVNTALDKNTMHAQRLNDLLIRGVRAPWSDLPPPADISMELPTVQNRAGGIMGFDGAGRPQVDGNFGLLLTLLAGGWAPGLSNIGWVASVAGLRALTPPASTAFVLLAGYYTASDKAAVLYRYETADTRPDDGGLILKPDSVAGGSPGRWVLLHDGTYSVVDWGADPTFTAPVDAQFAAWLTACMTYTARGKIPNGHYKFTLATYWNLDPVATGGLKIDGDSFAAILDFTNVASSPNLRIGGSTDLFKSSFMNFAVRGNIAGRVLQIGNDSYGVDGGGTPLFHDPINEFVIHLEVDNISASSNAVGARLNYFLNSPHCFLEVNTGGAGYPVELHQARFNVFLGSWSTGYCAVRYVAAGYSSNNVYLAIDMENVFGYPVICDSANASNETWIGGTFVWDNNDAGGGCFAMNAGNNNFRAIGAQPARYDAASIYPLAIGAKAAVVQFDTFIAGTFNFAAANVAPPPETPVDALWVSIIPNASRTGGMLVYRLVAGAPKARFSWLVDNSTESGGNVGSDMLLGRFNDAGTIIDNPIAVRRATGMVELAGGLALQVGSKFGAFGAVPIDQPGPSGVPALSTAGGPADPLYLTSKTTGGIGTLEYGMYEIVRVLKQLGLVAS